MTPPFVVASKASVIQKLLEGDRETLVFLVVGLVVASGILFVAARARRAINARRGRSLHAELEGSTLTEHSSGELIFEIQWAHAGIETRICGHQTGRKLEHQLPCPCPRLVARAEEVDAVSTSPPRRFVAFASAAGIDAGEFAGGAQKLTSGVIDAQVDAAHTAATPRARSPSTASCRSSTHDGGDGKLGGRLLESPPSAEQVDELVAAVVAGGGVPRSSMETTGLSRRPPPAHAPSTSWRSITPRPTVPGTSFPAFSGDTELDPDVLAHGLREVRHRGFRERHEGDRRNIQRASGDSRRRRPGTAGTGPTADRPPRRGTSSTTPGAAYHPHSPDSRPPACLRGA